MYDFSPQTKSKLPTKDDPICKPINQLFAVSLKQNFRLTGRLAKGRAIEHGERAKDFLMRLPDEVGAVIVIDLSTDVCGFFGRHLD